MEYHVFECCRTINGFNRSVIYDLGRKEFNFVPNALANFLQNDCLVLNEQTTAPETNEYLEFLLRKEYVYEAESAYLQQGFSKLNLEWDCPSHIENTIISLRKDKEHSELLSSSIDCLKGLNCFHVQLRMVGSFNQDNIVSLIKQFEYSSVNTIELLFEYNGCDMEFLKTLCEDFLRIQTVVVYNAPERKVRNFGTDSLGNIVLVQIGLDELLQSGVQDYQFAVNMPMFTEAQQHHTYFNRKLYIGSNGELKNAPECEESFGNINNLSDATQLKELVATPAFQQYWFVRKDECDVCKDCEFRYMCTDNRLPHQRTDGSWYHKQECNYNPYISKWKGEEGYRTLAESGIVSNADGFSIDTEKVAALNTSLWGE